jgi:hypothetical protein
MNCKSPTKHSDYHLPVDLAMIPVAAVKAFITGTVNITAFASRRVGDWSCYGWLLSDFLAAVSDRVDGCRWRTGWPYVVVKLT